LNLRPLWQMASLAKRAADVAALKQCRTKTAINCNEIAQMAARLAKARNYEFMVSIATKAYCCHQPHPHPCHNI